MRDKYDFLHDDKRQSFYKLVVSFFLVITRPQNSKFVISLQYLKKEGRDDVDFLDVDKHQTILQVDLINLSGHGQACSNYPK